VFGYTAEENRSASELTFEFVITRPYYEKFITLGAQLVGGNFVEKVA
jgi:hypothetical protein